ncbi:uncharacterized protein [Solanum lycopersicum]|uniref:uncharacterized protein n=1 Tax=Solanum lycopersicum TaxID=4081 RepID=UPI000532CB4F|nr:uncharacterized protein LOC104649276 [Solanum lycopersicum]
MGGLVTWKILKEFVDRFFPRDMREEKVTEFINLLQGGKSVHEYSFEFVKFSKYATSLVSDRRDQMSRFVMELSEDIQEECQLAMLHDNMTISRIMVKSFSSPKKKPTYGKFGKKHYGECLKGTDNFFSYGKSGHKMRDCPNLKSHVNGSGQAQASGSSDVPKKNRFYALHFVGEQDTPPDVVTSTLKIFTFDVYALIDPVSTLSFVTQLVTKKFDALLDILHEPFLVSTPVGESLVAKRVYRNYPI